MSDDATDVRRVGVVGSGLMGSGIAEVCARAGLRTLVYDVSQPALLADRNRLERSLDKAVARGGLASQDRESALEALSFTTDLDHIGLDTTPTIAESLHTEFREPQFAPPPLLSRMVQAGHLGRKSGRGFHTYPAT